MRHGVHRRLWLEHTAMELILMWIAFAILICLFFYAAAYKDDE